MVPVPLKETVWCRLQLIICVQLLQLTDNWQSMLHVTLQKQRRLIYLSLSYASYFLLLLLLIQRSNIRTVNNSTYLCGDQGWKYKGTCSAYRTGCIFVLLHYRDIPVITGKVQDNANVCPPPGTLKQTDISENINITRLRLHIMIHVLTVRLIQKAKQSHPLFSTVMH